MTRQPLHIRVAAALAGLAGFALIYTVIGLQQLRIIIHAADRAETQPDKEIQDD